MFNLLITTSVIVCFSYITLSHAMPGQPQPMTDQQKVTILNNQLTQMHKQELRIKNELEQVPYNSPKYRSLKHQYYQNLQRQDGLMQKIRTYQQ